MDDRSSNQQRDAGTLRTYMDRLFKTTIIRDPVDGEREAQAAVNDVCIGYAKKCFVLCFLKYD